MALAKNLKRARSITGKSIAQVSKDIGVSEHSLGLYEKGLRIPRDEIKEMLASYYGVSVQQFIE